MKQLAVFSVLVSATALSACHTLNPAAATVDVVDRAPDSCKRLGEVHMDWAWWGTPSETLNVLRNHTEELGGNTVVLMAPAIGMAYRCPPTKAPGTLTFGSRAL